MTSTDPPGSAVTVEAIFAPDGAIRPVAFTLSGRSHRIVDHGRQWTDDDGSRHFLVMTSPTAIYELVFVPTTLAWYAISKSAGHRIV